MALVSLGAKHVFDVAEHKPVHGMLDGSRVRVRFRRNEFARAFVRLNGVMSEHALLDAGDHYTLGPRLGANSGKLDVQPARRSSPAEPRSAKANRRILA